MDVLGRFWIGSKWIGQKQTINSFMIQDKIVQKIPSLEKKYEKTEHYF